MSSALLDLSNSFADAVAQAGRSVVSVHEGGRSGVSGTLWRDGLVVTAEHTIRGHQEVTVGLPSGETAQAAVVGRDSTTDVALLRLKDAQKTQIATADAAQLQVGHFVLAVGRRAQHGVVASHGIISALGPAWRTWRGGRIDHWFRLDLVPFTSFSGGPLVDASGRVIGINTSGPRRAVVTIPASTVNRVVDQLLVKGRIVRGYVGVGLQPVQLPAGSGASEGKTPGRGLVVVMIEPGAPADRAGLTIGDIVVDIAGEPVSDPRDLQAVLDPEHVGKPLSLRILRGGQAREVSLIVGERPE